VVSGHAHTRAGGDDDADSMRTDGDDDADAPRPHQLAWADSVG
jgi:hypothetical protein